MQNDKKIHILLGTEAKEKFEEIFRQDFEKFLNSQKQLDDDFVKALDNMTNKKRKYKK